VGDRFSSLRGCIGGSGAGKTKFWGDWVVGLEVLGFGAWRAEAEKCVREWWRGGSEESRSDRDFMGSGFERLVLED
jgi:hypothetical protein